MAIADLSEPGARGVLFLPHLAGERSPYLDPDSREAWVNLSLAHTQADLVRAVLEGVAFSLRTALEIINDITPVLQLLATGGGARSNTWLQILADVLLFRTHCSLFKNPKKGLGSSPIRSKKLKFQDQASSLKERRRVGARRFGKKFLPESSLGKNTLTPEPPMFFQNRKSKI